MTSYLERLASVDRRLDSFVDSLNKVPKVTAPRTQLLRLFITHKFVPSSAIEPDANGEKERPYFLVRLDGILFDMGDLTQRQSSLSSFLDGVSITVFADRKQNVLCSYEWNASSYGPGLAADSIVFKLAAEKSCACRVELRFSDHVTPKYTLSAPLRDLIQSKVPEMKKQEICDAFLHQVAAKRLFQERDSRIFRVDDAQLQPLFGEDRVCRTCDFWGKLVAAGHVLPVEKVEVDLSLSTAQHSAALQVALQTHLSVSCGNSNSSNTGAGSSTFGTALGNADPSNGAAEAPGSSSSSFGTLQQLCRAIGGRCLDLEVQRPSVAAISSATQLCLARAQAVEARYNCEQRCRSHQEALSFLRRELREDVVLCRALRDAVSQPRDTADTDAAQTQTQAKAVAGRKRVFSELLPTHPIPTEYVCFYFSIYFCFCFCDL